MNWWIITGLTLFVVFVVAITIVVVVKMFKKKEKNNTNTNLPNKSNITFRASYVPGISTGTSVSYNFIWSPPTSGYGPGYNFFYSYQLKNPKGDVILKSDNTQQTLVSIPSPYISGTYEIDVIGNNQFGKGPSSKASGNISLPSVKSCSVNWVVDSVSGNPYAELTFILQNVPAENVTVSAGEVAFFMNDINHKPIKNIPLTTTDGLTWTIAIHPAIKPPDINGYPRGFAFVWYFNYAGFWGVLQYSQPDNIPGSSPTDVKVNFMEKRAGGRLWGQTIGPTEGIIESTPDDCLSNCAESSENAEANGYSFWNQQSSSGRLSPSGQASGDNKNCWCVGKPYQTPKWTVDPEWISGTFS